ncbi:MULTISPECIES: hypothetical protein [unclassified Legionella]|uniref:hypothetical protein n=1 Tax=unclassified Legionella TaxID=2622702 RepID=UPI0010566317|nr:MULTISPECIES: hypothetical protein [unclassified Legionella]MDI9819729.1 hypothetical protein [Legionella sp. PL877]
MNIPMYPKHLLQLLKKRNHIYQSNYPLPIEHNDGVVREMRLQDSIENNTDPNDMPLEVAKNLESNLGPIDTEGELEAKGLKNKDLPDNKEAPLSPRF